MCAQCGVSTSPGGRPAEDARYFYLPAPYKLSGPKPDEQFDDVERLATACRDNNHPFTMYEGLVMCAGSGGTFLVPSVQWYVLFNQDSDGHQTFAEASGGGVLIRDIEDLLAYFTAFPGMP